MNQLWKCAAMPFFIHRHCTHRCVSQKHLCPLPLVGATVGTGETLSLGVRNELSREVGGGLSE